MWCDPSVYSSQMSEFLVASLIKSSKIKKSWKSFIKKNFAFLGAGGMP